MDAFVSQHGVIVTLFVLAAVSGLGWVGLQLRADRFGMKRHADDDRHDEGLWWWLRWTAMVTVIAIWAVVAIRAARGVPFRVPSMTLLMTGVVVVTVQWFNVWFVIWPALATGGANARRVAAAALRLNNATVLSALFFLVSSNWAPTLGGGGRWIPQEYWIATVAAYGGLEAVALFLPRVMLLVRTPIGLLALSGVTLLTRYYL